MIAKFFLNAKTVGVAIIGTLVLLIYLYIGSLQSKLEQKEFEKSVLEKEKIELSTKLENEKENSLFLKAQVESKLELIEKSKTIIIEKEKRGRINEKDIDDDYVIVSF